MQYYYDEIYSETVPFSFIKYIIFSEGALGVLFLILYVMQISGNLIPDEELPSFFWLIMAAVMLGVAAFLTTLTRLRIGITQDTLRASFGFIKFETALSNINNIYEDKRSGLTYGGWGVRISRIKGGTVLTYTALGQKKVIVELKNGKYKFFVFSTSNPEEVINTVNSQLRR
jgi:hypothetical protein